MYWFLYILCYYAQLFTVYWQCHFIISSIETFSTFTFLSFPILYYNYFKYFLYIHLKQHQMYYSFASIIKFSKPKRRRKGYSHLSCSLFPYNLPLLLLLLFLFSLENFLNHSIKVSLQVTNSLAHHLKIYWFPLHSGGFFLLGIKFWVEISFCFFHSLKNSMPCSFGLHGLWWKMYYHFCLLAFFPLIFRSL